MRSTFKVKLLLAIIILILTLFLCKYNISMATDTLDDASNLTVDDSTNEDTNLETWTDFSNATYSFVKDGQRGSKLEISGITPNSDCRYCILFTETAEKVSDNIDSNPDRISLSCTDGKLVTTGITKYVELNQELYFEIIELNSSFSEYHVDTYGNKLTRYEEPTYADAFSNTVLSYNHTQIVTNFTHSSDNTRKIQIKIGKITDTTILQKIKNGESSGLSDLLTFAKNSQSMYDENLVDSDDLSFISYSTNESLLDINDLEDGAYYYLYLKTDDENGKYFSNEGVTLARASIHPSENTWFMFFYGSNDFEWTNFASENSITPSGDAVAQNEDNSIADSILPYTGKAAIKIIVGMFAIICVGIVFYKKYQYYKEI